MQRKIRVLVGKPGLDGHDRGAKVVAAALRDAGMEVIYTGLHQSAEQIVEAALQEDVDVVALSILSGAHMTLFPDVLELMKKRGVGDKLLTGGGIIPAEDMETLAKRGVGKLFGPGSSTQDIARYIREWFVGRFGVDSLAPMPPVTRRDVPVDASVSAPSAKPKSTKPKSTAKRAGRAAGRAAAARPKRTASAKRATASRTRTARVRSARSSRSATPRRTAGRKR
jgi:methylmalonyl-CoA mutase C-terminal domain/subunit